MNRFLSIALLLLAAISANARDRFARDPEQISIATTGRILRIDFKSKMLRVRGSDSQGQPMPIRNISQMMQSLKQKIGFTLPGGITIGLPGRGAKGPAKPSADPVNNLDEYNVIITSDTVFQDGSDNIRLEDFKAGETISIRGTLSGTSLTATRIAKWS